MSPERGRQSSSSGFGAVACPAVGASPRTHSAASRTLRFNTDPQVRPIPAEFLDIDYGAGAEYRLKRKPLPSLLAPYGHRTNRPFKRPDLEMRARLSDCSLLVARHRALLLAEGTLTFPH